MAEGGTSFFFQAEDGIRDGTVTGVQACALEISPCAPPGWWWSRHPGTARPRSEERRVGKEGRARWAPHHKTNNHDVLDKWRKAGHLFFFKPKTAYEMEL